MPKYHVYVIELKRSACAHHSSAEHRRRRPMYVGQTVLEPEARYQQHAEGYKSSSAARRYHRRLRYDLAEGWGRYKTRDEALNAEKSLAEHLRQRGWCVFGGH